MEYVRQGSRAEIGHLRPAFRIGHFHASDHREAVARKHQGFFHEVLVPRDFSAQETYGGRSAFQHRVVIDAGQVDVAAGIRALHPRRPVRTVDLQAPGPEYLAFQALGGQLCVHVQQGELVLGELDDCEAAGLPVACCQQVGIGCYPEVFRRKRMVGDHRPSVQQRLVVRLAAQHVHRPVQDFPPGAFTGEDGSLLFGSRQDERLCPSNRRSRERAEAPAFPVDFQAVRRVPVAAYEHSAVLEGKGCRPGALAVEYAVRTERAGMGVVGLHAPALPDSEVLGSAAQQHYPAVRKLHCRTVVVGVHHLQLVPGAAGEVLRRLHRLEAVGMPAEDGDFVSQQDCAVAAAGRQ